MDLIEISNKRNKYNDLTQCDLYIGQYIDNNLISSGQVKHISGDEGFTGLVSGLLEYLSSGAPRLKAYRLSIEAPISKTKVGILENIIKMQNSFANIAGIINDE